MSAVNESKITLRPIGVVEVDSGMILLVDPCRAEQAAQLCRAPFSGRNPVPLTTGEDKRMFAVVVPTQSGDGPHGVFVEEEDGQPVRLIVDLR